MVGPHFCRSEVLVNLTGFCLDSYKAKSRYWPGWVLGTLGRFISKLSYCCGIQFLIAVEPKSLFTVCQHRTSFQLFKALCIPSHMMPPSSNHIQSFMLLHIFFTSLSTINRRKCSALEGCLSG